MRIASILLGVVGGVVLASCILTAILFEPGMLLWTKLAVGGSMLLASLVLHPRAVFDLIWGRAGAYLGRSALLTLAAGCGVVAVNLLAAHYDVQVDITRAGLYTLAPQTQKVLAAIDHEVEVLGFYKSHESASDTLRQMVHRYQELQPRITLRILDPERHTREAREYDIRDKGARVVLRCQGRATTIATINEQAFTRGLLRVTRAQKPRAYVLVGHGELDLQDSEEMGLSALAQDLRRQGNEVLPLSLVELGQVPVDADVVVIAGPRSALLAGEIESLRAYLDGGGRLLLMLEPLVEPGLRELLRRYGLGYGEGLVLEPAALSSGSRLAPDAITVLSYRPHPVVSSLRGAMTVLHGVRPLDLEPITDKGLAKSAQVLPLMFSGPRSWAEHDLSAAVWHADGDDPRGPFVLAATVTVNTSTVAKAQRRSPEMRLMVVGDASFAANRFRQQQANRDLVLNALAWLMDRPEEIAIRPRLRGASRIVLSARQEAWLAFISLDALPVGLFALGMVIWLLRRRGMEPDAS